MKVTKLPLSRAVAIVCVFLTATAAKAEAEYTFTVIADSAGLFRDFSFDSPSLNVAGKVAFNATLDNGARGVFTATEGS